MLDEWAIADKRSIYFLKKKEEVPTACFSHLSSLVLLARQVLGRDVTRLQNHKMHGITVKDSPPKSVELV